MSAPIDKLLISVEIEQGSNLENLHKMLKDLQKAGGTGKFKADVDLSGVASKRQIGNVHDKINELTNILKPLIQKFEPLLESATDLIQEHIEEFGEFIKNFTGWTTQFDESFGLMYNDIASRIEALVKLIKEQLSGDTLTGKREDDLQDITFWLAKIKASIDEITMELEKLPNEFTKTKKYMNRQFNKTIKPLIQEIREMIQFASQIQEDFYKFEQIDVMISGMSEKMNEVIKVLEEAKGQFEKAPEIESFIQDLQDLLDFYIDKKFNLVTARFDDIRKMFVEIATRGDVHEIRTWWKDLETYIKDIVRETKDDYWLVQKDIAQIKGKLDKIPMERTETRRIIEEYYDKALTKFKTKLDQNLSQLLSIEFTEFMDSLAATADVRREGLLPIDFKPFGGVGTGEDISDSMKNLLRRMLKQPMDALMKNINVWLQQDMSRQIQEMSPVQLLAGIKQETPKTLNAELITRWSDQLEKNNTELLEARRSFNWLSSNVEHNTHLIKNNVMRIFMPTLQGVQRIQSLLDEPKQVVKDLNKDMSNKGEEHK